jgi:hypothetical protein
LSCLAEINRNEIKKYSEKELIIRTSDDLIYEKQLLKLKIFLLSMLLVKLRILRKKRKNYYSTPIVRYRRSTYYSWIAELKKLNYDV